MVRVVRIREGRFADDKPRFQRHPAVGDVGTVLEVYSDPPGFHVECGDDGSPVPIWLECFESDELELIDYDRRPTTRRS